MFKFQSILLSGIEKISRPFLGTWLRKIPGVRRTHRFLKEFPWLFSYKTIMEIEGSKMYLNAWEKSPIRETFRSYIRSYKEPLTTKVFKGIVKEGDSVIDVGANIGYFSLLAARLVGEKGKVYSFEPEPLNYNFLCKNIELNNYKNITAYQKAVSNKVGTVKLYIANETGAHTLREYHDTSYFTDKNFGKFVEVESIILDDFFIDKHDKIDVIKMDVEGSEMLVFLGMDKIIKKNRNIKIVTEFCPSFIREMKSSPEGLGKKIMEDYGFKVTVIDELRTPTNQYIEVNSVNALMDICEGKDKIVNLLLEMK